MKKLICIFFLSILMLISSSICVFAHPGSLDENGGHMDHKTGEYHYHDGTNQGNSGSSGENNYYYDKYKYESFKETVKDTSEEECNNNVLWIILVIVAVITIVGIIFLYLCEKNKK